MYSKKDQILYTYNKYIVDSLKDLKEHKSETKHIRVLLNNYKLINELNQRMLDGKTFD